MLQTWLASFPPVRFFSRTAAMASIPCRARFNEAEARAPRMLTSRSATATSRPNRGFNEAEARAPRMPQLDGVAVDRRVDASMRPRRARLGCSGRRHERDHARDASMRPRRARLGCASRSTRSRSEPTSFNEAEARAPRMQLSRLNPFALVRVASMRPRRARLGCDVALCTLQYQLPLLLQ